MAYRLRSWLDDRLEVRPSPIEGNGLFARSPIQLGELIAEIGGIPYRDNALDGPGPSAHSSVAIDEGQNLVQDDDDPLRFGNHSCDPNAWMDGEVRIVARRDIPAGQEVTIDYALQSGYPRWSMSCRCGAADCRGTVSGDDWRRPDLRARYAGHWSPFLQRRIDRLR